MGEPVYRRIGFRTVEDYRFWLPPGSTEGSAGDG
jgi:hypothetical protein